APDLLLLDEPTNHLDAESVGWLERHLAEYAGTIVAVTHDRYFLDNVAGWILELDRGRGIPWEGNYTGWLEQKEQRLAQEEKVDETRRRTLERELEWVRMAPKARQAKGKARLAAYEKLLAESKAAEGRSDGLEIFIPSGERLGDQDVSTLSGGERRRVAHCRLLLQKPDLLLLDEPTNHLDAESVAWLERHLQEYHGTVVAVTHDRYFLDNVAGWILELDRGAGIPWEGNYTSWLEQKEQRLAQEEKVDETRRRTLQRELEWVRMAPRARQAKGKARITAYDKLVAEAESAEKRQDKVQISIPPGPRLGDLVIEAEQISKGYGDRLLIESFSFSLPPGGIVGVIGANGAGKTTLFRMLVGREEPDGGSLKIGPTVQLAYVDQSRESLDADKTVYEEITGGVDLVKVGDRDVHGRAYVAGLNFKGSDQQKRVGDLSGGERNRLHLAKALLMGGNVLLLDEPTNDLDVDTLRALEEALLEFPGCAVVISHDRWFLDRIATHVLAFEGDSQVTWFEGNFSDYETDRHRRLGGEADQPHRLKYKPLTR
ncbi:MAG: hypothetical protein QOH28_1367, partial [Actinomycetota bacterium]|nr:hypothetical protein [Actinomycetota bacterium]